MESHFSFLVRRNIDIRYLPVIVPEGVRNDTARVVQPELLSRINKVREMIDAGVVDQESSQGLQTRFSLRSIIFITLAGSNPETGCGFVVYAQIEPSSIPASFMQDLEDELQKPTGKWTTKRPPLRLNGMLVSGECGLLYRLHDAVGLRYANDELVLTAFQCPSVCRSQSFFRKVTNC